MYLISTWFINNLAGGSSGPKTGFDGKQDCQQIVVTKQMTICFSFVFNPIIHRVGGVAPPPLPTRIEFLEIPLY